MRRRQSNRRQPQIEWLESRALPAISLVSGVLTIQGTASADDAVIFASGTQIVARMVTNGMTDQQSFAASTVFSYYFTGAAGNDRFINDTALPGIAVGQGGSDYLEGGSGADTLRGGNGNDTLVGFTGNDKLLGKASSDYLFGLPGDDLISGELGDDFQYGGPGTDTFTDTSGNNTTDQDGDGPLAAVTAGLRSQKLEDYINGDLSFIESEVIRLTNIERVNAGLPAFTTSSKLVDAAQHHATNMAYFNMMAHTLPQADLPTLVDRLNHYNYSYWSAGENIAWNYANAEAVVQAWMSSSGHRANILNPSFTEIGVGVRYNTVGQPYYCQVFGQPR